MLIKISQLVLHLTHSDGQKSNSTRVLKKPASLMIILLLIHYLSNSSKISIYSGTAFLSKLEIQEKI